MSTLTELFSRLEHDKASLDEVIAAFRSMRHSFHTGNMKAGNTKPKSEKAKAIASIKDKVDLGGLDL